ncbi:hypothetical protein YW7DRAFT_04828 [Streptomyces sp. AmelKG-E11A]|nr:hypothetical protein YW7DRAFT_04828 [Streptomyces sp. AmelKG-E11A]
MWSALLAIHMPVNVRPDLRTRPWSLISSSRAARTGARRAPTPLAVRDRARTGSPLPSGSRRNRPAPPGTA